MFHQHVLHHLVVAEILYQVSHYLPNTEKLTVFAGMPSNEPAKEAA